MRVSDSVWLKLGKEHQRRADICAVRHREDVAAGRFGPVVKFVLIPPGYKVAAVASTDAETPERKEQ